jgi:ketosteroid isomerase-like protein
MKTNLEIVKEGYTNFLQGNIPALLDTLSDNIEWELPASSRVNFSGCVQRQRCRHGFLPECR